MKILAYGALLCVSGSITLLGCDSDEGTSSGAQGAAGEVGPKGDEGATGATGAQGDVGPQGTEGVAGVDGPTGAAGVTGPQGETGAPGQQGPQGVPGTAANQGPQGETGPQGAQGDQGLKGDPGLSGAPGLALYDRDGNRVEALLGTIVDTIAIGEELDPLCVPISFLGQRYWGGRLHALADGDPAACYDAFDTYDDVVSLNAESQIWSFYDSVDCSGEALFGFAGGPYISVAGVFMEPDETDPRTRAYSQVSFRFENGQCATYEEVAGQAGTINNLLPYVPADTAFTDALSAGPYTVKIAY